MSEQHVYKFGDWVEVQDEKDQWERGRYVYNDGTAVSPHFILLDDGKDGRYCHRVRPASPAPPPEGTERVEIQLCRARGGGSLYWIDGDPLEQDDGWEHVCTVVAHIPARVEPPVIEGEVITND